MRLFCSNCILPSGSPFFLLFNRCRNTLVVHSIKVANCDGRIWDLIDWENCGIHDSRKTIVKESCLDSVGYVNDSECCQRYHCHPDVSKPGELFHNKNCNEYNLRIRITSQTNEQFHLPNTLNHESLNYYSKLSTTIISQWLFRWWWWCRRHSLTPIFFSSNHTSSSVFSFLRRCPPNFC